MEPIRHLQERYKGGIWGPEDHAHSKTQLYCPVAIFNMTENTFIDPSVFTQSQLTLQEAEAQVRASLPPKIRSTCAWAFRNQQEKIFIPKAFILPKEKRAIQKPAR